MECDSYMCGSRNEEDSNEEDLLFENLIMLVSPQPS